MVAPSRLPKITFDQVFEGKTCCSAVHKWTESCTRASLEMAWSCFIGANRFFIPIYVAQFLVKNKNIDREYLKKQAKAYMKSVLFGWFMGTTFLPVCCPLWYLTGFSHYLTVFVPALVGGLGIFFEHHHKRGFMASSYAGFVLEYIVRQLQEVGLIRITVARSTALFMVSNAIMLYLLRSESFYKNIKKSNNVWFFIPPGVVDQYSNKESEQYPRLPRDFHTCPHKGPCWRYILKMTGKYGGLGLALQLVRKLLPQMKFLLRTPSDFVKRVYNRNNLLFGAYLAGYVGLYTVTSCVLCRVAGQDSALHAIPAGFLAGLVYPLQPNTAIVFTSMTTVVLLLARRAVVLGLVSHWPKMTGLIFGLCFAILTHGLATDRDMCSPFIRATSSTATNGWSEMITNDYHKLKQELITKLLAT